QREQLPAKVRLRRLPKGRSADRITDRIEAVPVDTRAGVVDQVPIVILEASRSPDRPRTRTNHENQRHEHHERQQQLQPPPPPAPPRAKNPFCHLAPPLSYLFYGGDLVVGESAAWACPGVAGIEASRSWR